MNASDDIFPSDTDVDPELDQLEAYLDDALDPAEMAAVRARLAADAGLSAVLAGLRAERADRSAVWTSLEPDDRAIEQLCWRVRGAVAAERRPAPAARRPWARFVPDPWQLTRFTSAAAACVLLGFFGGRLGRGPTPPPSVAASGPVPVVATGPVEVPITDEYGRFVTSQKFRTDDEARQFLSDLHPARDGDASAVPGPARNASELRY